MLFSVMPKPHDEHILVLEGTADELLSYHEDGPAYDVVVGFDVIRIGDGRHDGHPATVITLADTDGDREVGRFVIRKDAGVDSVLTWERVFENDDDAGDFVEFYEAMKSRPKLSSVTLDYMNIDETLEEALANASAKFGVSARVLKEHGPGGGCPVVEFSGLTENVYKLLRSKEPYGYGLDEGEIKEHLG